VLAGPIATLTDADTATGASQFVATINWGDGHISVATVRGASGSFVVSGRHRYTRDGRYAVTVAITMTGPVSVNVNASGTVVVSNLPRHVQRARIVHRLISKAAKPPRLPRSESALPESAPGL
jgi:hypothetical protein